MHERRREHERQRGRVRKCPGAQEGTVRVRRAVARSRGLNRGRGDTGTGAHEPKAPSEPDTGQYAVHLLLLSTAMVLPILKLGRGGVREVPGTARTRRASAQTHSVTTAACGDSKRVRWPARS